MWGKHHSEEHKKKLREYRGEKASNWQGGKTKLNDAVRECYKNDKWKATCFTRDNFICQHCSARGVKLNVEHKKDLSVILKENKITSLEMALGCEELWNIDNGITLCVECHKKETKIKRELRKIKT